MKTIHAFLVLTLATAAVSCTQSVPLPTPSSQTFQVPNGDFEFWNNQLPIAWQTNSCPPCVPAYETYIVQQDTNAYQGQYAAKFIYNNVFPATADNGFAISRHPAELKAYVMSNLAANDSVRISVAVFNNNVVVDSGEWFGTTSVPVYTQIQIPISQNATQVDSISISIEGGHVNAYPSNNTEFWVDAVTLE
jgi:hypothetical protein